MYLVEELRRNDPETTDVRIHLSRPSLDADLADLAQALEQNPFVTEIHLEMDGEQRVDWNCLLRVIATRANLEKVGLSDYSPHRKASPALVRSILRAIQQNPAIRSVTMLWLHLPSDISTFVDTASSITMFHYVDTVSSMTLTPFGRRFVDFAIPAAEREQGARSLAVALQRNTNIEILKLFKLEETYAIPILGGLQSNTSVKAFSCSLLELSDATSHALQCLLESTTSIQRFELCDESFSNERLFHPIAQGIINSECMSELKLSSVSFQGQNSLAPLQSILLNKQNLTSLCLHKCHFGRGQVHGIIISILSRADSLLRCFEFHSRRLEEAFPGVQYKNLLRAIEKSNLERFKIGSIQSQQYLQTLVQSIPSAKLKELEVKLFEFDFEEECELDRETIMQDLFHAVKNNFSLRSVTFELFIEVPYSLDRAEDKMALEFYTSRNKSLDQWADNPETVEPKVWPDALGLAQRAGPDALFRALRSTLGSDNVSWKGKRSAKVHNAPTQPSPWTQL